MPTSFLPTHDVVAVYRLLVPLPVTVALGRVEYRIGLALSECPPFVSAWLQRERREPGYELARYETLEQAHWHLATGFEVEARSLIETVFEVLCSEGRAVCVAGRHCELYWLPYTMREEAPLDRYYDWTADPAHEVGEQCVFACGLWRRYDERADCGGYGCGAAFLRAGAESRGACVETLPPATRLSA